MDLNQPEARSAFVHAGAMVKTDMTSKFSTGEDLRRADLLIGWRGKAYAVECKQSRSNSWDTSEWKVEQREWAKNYCIAAPFEVPYFVFLTIGARVNAKAGSPEKKRSWLVPFHKMIEIIEELESLGTKTLPAVLTSDYRIALRQAKLSAVTRLAAYELEWITKEERRPHERDYKTLYSGWKIEEMGKYV